MPWYHPPLHHCPNHSCSQKYSHNKPFSKWLALCSPIMATTTAVVSKSIALANIVKHRHYELREAVERAKLNEKVGNDDESGGSGRGGGSAGKACTADTAAAAAADTAATTDRDVWNQHLRDDAGLAKYAEAMHELATKEWTEAGTVIISSPPFFFVFVYIWYEARLVWARVTSPRRVLTRLSAHTRTQGAGGLCGASRLQTPTF